MNTGSMPMDISAVMSKLMENPEIVGSVMSALGGAKNESAAEASPLEKLPDIMSALKPMLSGGGEAKSPGGGNREALLHALRPYLSEGRREMVDSILRFGRIGDMMKNLR